MQIRTMARNATIVALFVMTTTSSISSYAANITRIEHEGRVYEVKEGWVYEVDQRSGNRNRTERIYDNNFLRDNYRTSGGKTRRVVPGHGELDVQRNFHETFEGASHVRDLIGPGKNWTSMTLQSPDAPTVGDYVKLRTRILKGKEEFRDSRMDPSSERKHSGTQSLKLFAEEPSWRMDLTKTSIDTELVYFGRGDNFWFSGWFYLESGRPTGILDIESSYTKHGPGMRILFDDELRPRAELKFAHKPTYRMGRGNSFRFPSGKWVEVKLHLYLMDDDNGRIELWMDNQKVLDANGPTLPVADVVYNRMQVGITANPDDVRTTMFLDDVRVSDSEL